MLSVKYHYKNKTSDHVKQTTSVRQDTDFVGICCMLAKKNKLAKHMYIAKNTSTKHVFSQEHVNQKHGERGVWKGGGGGG